MARRPWRQLAGRARHSVRPRAHRTGRPAFFSRRRVRRRTARNSHPTATYRAEAVSSRPPCSITKTRRSYDSHDPFLPESCTTRLRRPPRSPHRGVRRPRARWVNSLPLIGPRTIPGAASGFALLGASAVTCTNLSAVTGDVGVSPGTAITGFNPSCTITGTIRARDTVAAQGHADLGIASRCTTPSADP